MGWNRIRTIPDAKASYKRYSGVHCNPFFCPISLEEHNSEVIDGHIIPDSWNISNITTPQVKDVDSFFGYAFQCNTTHLQRTSKILDDDDPANLIHNLHLISKHHKTKIWLGSDSTEIYKTTEKRLQSIPGNHSVFKINNQYYAIKASPNTFQDKESEYNITIDTLANEIDSYFVTLLHSAHLTMFYFLGYKYVFSESGIWVATKLKSIYEHRLNRAYLLQHTRTLVKECVKIFSGFGPLQFMGLNSTLMSCTAFACYKKSRTPFGLMLIIEDGTQKNGIVIPWLYESRNNTPLSLYQDYLRSGDNAFQIQAVRFNQESSLNYVPSPFNGTYVQFANNPSAILDDIDDLVNTGFPTP